MQSYRYCKQRSKGKLVYLILIRTEEYIARFIVDVGEKHSPLFKCQPCNVGDSPQVTKKRVLSVFYVCVQIVLTV